MAAVLEMGELSQVVLVSIAYFILMMIFMMHQVFAKIDAGAMEAIQKRVPFNRFDYASSPRWEMADRTFSNLLEREVIFLLPLWLHAVFVDPGQSASLGWFWLGFRLLFPILWSVKGAWTVLIEISTQGGYAIESYLMLAVAYKAATGRILLPDSACPLTLALYTVGATIAVHVVVLPGGTLLTAITKRGFSAPASSGSAPLLGEGSN